MPANPEVDNIGLHAADGGWCVYNFHEADPVDHEDPEWTGELDITEEQDFDTYEEALAEAERRSEHFGVSINEY